MENPFKPTEKYPVSTVVITALFAFAGIGILALLDEHFDNQWIVASFGSTAVLIYAAPKAPFSKPKNVFFGHMFSAAVSLAIVFIFDALNLYSDMIWIVCGLCVASAIIIMMFTGTIHPPAGATALTIGVSHTLDIQFLLFPLALGLLTMMLLAFAANMLKDKFSKK